MTEQPDTAEARIAAALADCDAMDRSADADWPEPSRSTVFVVTATVRRALTGDTA